MFNHRWAALMLYWLLALAAHATELQPDGQSYQRRRWTQADGAPQQALTATQTDDGMLWFASAVGLYNFDGMRFRKVSKVYGHDLRSTNVMSTHKVAGALAVGYYFGGLSLFTPERATHYAAGRGFPRGSVMDITTDKNNVMYVATSSGVVTLQDGKWLPVGQDSLPKGSVRWVNHDKAGRLWVNIASENYVRPLGSERFVHAQVPPKSRVTWCTDGMYFKPPGQQYQVLDIQAAPRPAPLDQPARYQSSPIPGPHGTLWATREDGLVRLAPGSDGVLRAAELFPTGTERDTIYTSTTIDRENNLWLLTPGGVERYRRHRFHRLPAPVNAFYWLAQRGFGDELWLGAAKAPLARLKSDGSRQETTLDAPHTLLRLAPDLVWVGTADALWEFHGDTQQRWDLPAGMEPSKQIQALAAGQGGRLLVSITRSGLWTFEHGQWEQDQRLRGQEDATPISMLTGANGKTWLGMTNNRLAELSATEARLLPASAGLRIGNVLSLLDVGGKLLAGGEQGVAWIEGGRAHAMKLQQPDSLQRVTGMVLDRQGNLWLHSNDGLHRIPAQDLARYWSAPQTALQAELFNFEDGVTGMAAQARPQPSLALAHDGRLYYATITDVGWIDPASIPRNPRAPTVLLQSLRTPEQEYLPADKLVLPQQTSAIELSFTAAALSIPERVRLKFRLDGVDQDWREAGPERRAQYTNLPPGPYRFRVIAANEDGVWNLEGAQFSFRIEPAFWQTAWFHLACALVLLAAAALLYRWRVSVIRRRAEQYIALRMDATLQERGRIARSLHDNLLQAVQALLLRFHVVEQKLAQQPELQRLAGQALDYAESLVASTRDEVMELRRAPGVDELFAALRDAAAQAAPGAEQRLSFTVTGQPRQLRAEAGPELACVLREAVLNSVLHAQARHIDVRLAFLDTGLQAEVCDDGVGIDPAVARHGKSGHWGITGMRERIGRLGGEVEIGKGPAGGTAVRLALSMLQAYA
ncbi:sensor histidine kinase [Pseudoduganella aquatica]|uniref:sensor histidine kinase n=1 Tax=Pseudoduganella aquatica TaxID=2660641 RepID=UPI001E53BFCD|nr:sensor histidine kinase [Pseudoduganella aquatica]